jgi:N-acetylglucosaminyl-diphospho-decaprenol L-rhamnosyltransferase
MSAPTALDMGERRRGRDWRVTVVIASRNRRDVLVRNLPRTLELPEHPRVILVDDASTDGTPEAVRAAHPEVEVIELERHMGSAARNMGLRAAQTPYVAFCDDDSWWEPGALTAAADLLDEHPRLAVVNGHVLVGPDEHDDPICVEMAESPLPAAEGQPGHPLLSFVACAVVVRRDAILAAGGFQERFLIGGEEELLGWDLAGAGWQLSYVPQLLAHHHPPPHTGRPDRREVGIRNTLWTTWLRRPLRTAATRTARDLRRFPRDRTTARAVMRAVAGLPWILRERRVSPPHIEHMRRLLEQQQLRSHSRRYVD